MLTYPHSGGTHTYACTHTHTFFLPIVGSLHIQRAVHVLRGCAMGQRPQLRGQKGIGMKVRKGGGLGGCARLEPLLRWGHW